LFCYANSASTSCNGQATNTLSMESCHKKSICAHICPCGKVSFFDVKGSGLDQAYRSTCIDPKVTRAKAAITDFINNKLRELAGVIGRLAKAAKKKKLLGGKTKKAKRAGQQRNQTVQESKDVDSIRPILIGFAEKVRHLCEQASLGQGTPVQQQDGLWKKYLNGRTVPRQATTVAAEVLKRTVSIFDARCLCSSFATNLKSVGDKQCSNICGGSPKSTSSNSNSSQGNSSKGSKDTSSKQDTSSSKQDDVFKTTESKLSKKLTKSKKSTQSTKSSKKSTKSSKKSTKSSKKTKKSKKSVTVGKSKNIVTKKEKMDLTKRYA